MKSNYFLGSTLAVALLFAAGDIRAQHKTDEYTNITTSFSGETTINTTENGQRFKIRLVNDKITEMYIDDKKIDEADFGKYEAMVNKIMVQLEKDRKQATEDRARAEKDREQATKDREQAAKDRARAEEDRKHAEADRARADLDRARAEEGRKQAVQDRASADKHRLQVDKDRAQAVKDREQAEKDRAQANLDRKQGEKDREQAENDRAQAAVDRKRAEEDRKLMETFLDEIVSDKLVESRESLKNLTLDSEQLTVNGVKQPENMHKKYKSKYLKSNSSRIQYRNSDGYRGMSMD